MRWEAWLPCSYAEKYLLSALNARIAMQAAKLLNETAQQQLLESCVRLLTLRKVVYLLIYKDLFIYLFYKIDWGDEARNGSRKDQPRKGTAVARSKSKNKGFLDCVRWCFRARWICHSIRFKRWTRRTVGSSRAVRRVSQWKGELWPINASIQKNFFFFRCSRIRFVLIAHSPYYSSYPP